jgi:hypothetical protein
MGKDAHAMMEDDAEIRWARIREAQFGKSAAKLASLTKRLLPELCGGLWHTTHPDRFKSILSGGAILPEPNIPDGDRYCTGLGKDHYPYVRTLGGVSLFDFNGFDTDAYTNEYPSSTWATFVPYRTDWGSSVWIEINREQVAPDLISGFELLAKWKSDGAHGHNIMPEIEVAHIGPIPRAAFRRALLVGNNDSLVHSILLDV